MLAIALLLPLLIARHLQGSHTRGNIARSARASLLSDLAKAAVAEGWWQLERAAADSGSPTYLVLRAGATTPQVIQVDVPHLTQLLDEDPVMAGCKLSENKVKVTIGKRTPTSSKTREGLADVTLEAKMVNDGVGIFRIVRETREMRLVLAALPIPFDQHSLMVIDAHALVGDQTNAWMEEAVSTVTQIAGGAKAAGATDIGGEPPPPLVDDLTKEIHRFPTKYLLQSADAAIPDVTAIYLLPKMEGHRRRIEALGPASDLSGKAASDPSGTASKARAIVAAHNALLAEARVFQHQFLENGPPESDNFAAAATQLAPAEWRRRALFTFTGAGAAAKFVAMLDKYAAEDPPRCVNGVAYVDDPDAPLKLKNRAMRGRLVICSTGAVELDSITVVNAKIDLLTVQTQGTLTTNGRIEANLVACGGVQMAADTVVSGSLTLDTVRGLDKYGGKLECDLTRLNVQTGGLDRPEMFWVAFSPFATKREMVLE